MIKDALFFGRKCNVFTLQWHITNACPNHCLHCYDRSSRSSPGLNEIHHIISDFLCFCKKFNVEPRIALSGGDPFCHPHIFDIIRIIAEKGIAYSILGNPISTQQLEKMIAIQRPIYFQVSLEGEQTHNDAIRGDGNFKKTMRFLQLANAAGIATHVMLTLTPHNIHQVIPLAKALQGIAMRFAFNRLSRAGEAKDFQLPDKNAFIAILHNYTREAKRLSVCGFKDNLFNVMRHHNKKPLFGGCTGAGCGAAFNFVAILPDGEVHACRKFPSYLGNIFRQSLLAIYASEAAAQYRRGSSGCKGCSIKWVCGGCLASTWSAGLDPLRDRDPYCFMEEYDEARARIQNAIPALSV